MEPTVAERKDDGAVADEEVSATDARDRLTELINRAAYGGERIVITRNGKPVAAIVRHDAAA